MEADRLREILDLLEESLDEPQLAAAELAGRAYLSRFHFDRLVRSALDEPPGAFRCRILLERSAYRFGTGQEPVIEIALGAGYGGPEAFTRALPGPTASRRRRSGQRAGRTTACQPPTESTSCPRAASGCPPPEGASP